MNFYEVLTTDGSSFMLNLELIETVHPFPDRVKLTTVSGHEYQITHQTFSAAILHNKVGYFKIENEAPKEVAEDETVVVEGVEVL